ncbi:MAG: phosphopantothenoylcysteine decarboxylase [Planctomycetes bacterium]|nr:phosphopantothenoylcysteine decarboxylase [Planctomycetota bacterium]
MAAKKILFGVSGGIAVYKACEVVRRLVKGEKEVRVIMTANAMKFVTPMTFEVLSKNPVPIDMFASRSNSNIEHVEAAIWCDLFCVVPATANLIGKLASGIADDLLTTLALAIPAKKPCLLAPAMNVHMWENEIVQRNLKTLSQTGGGRFEIIPPVKKELACGDIGMGGLASIEDIYRAVVSASA